MSSLDSYRVLISPPALGGETHTNLCSPDGLLPSFSSAGHKDSDLLIFQWSFFSKPSVRACFSFSDILPQILKWLSRDCEVLCGDAEVFSATLNAARFL